MKRDDWELALHAVLSRHARLAFGYGSSDCYLIVADTVKAITGKNPFPNSRRYKTEAGAAKTLRRFGFENVEQAWASKFEEIPVSMISRGDIAIVETEFGVAGAVWDGAKAFTKGPAGNVFLGMREIKRAFRVE